MMASPQMLSTSMRDITQFVLSKLLIFLISVLAGDRALAIDIAAR